MSNILVSYIFNFFLFVRYLNFIWRLVWFLVEYPKDISNWNSDIHQTYYRISSANIKMQLKHCMQTLSSVRIQIVVFVFLVTVRKAVLSWVSLACLQSWGLLSLFLPDFLINPSLLASSVNIGPGHNPDNQCSCFFKNKGRIQMLIYFDSIFYIFIGFVKK